jgi:hypothetical protein
MRPWRLGTIWGWGPWGPGWFLGVIWFCNVYHLVI